MATTEKFICPECVNNLGYEFRPEARAAPAYIGVCDYCRKVKLVASHLNWKIPNPEAK